MKRRNIHKVAPGVRPMTAVCGSKSGLFAFMDAPITCVRCLARLRRDGAQNPHQTPVETGKMEGREG